MANNNDIQLKIDTILDTKGADVTYKGITKQIKDLNSLALQYKDTNVDAFEKINRQAAELQGNLNDIKDAMKAADGSQLESLNNSVFLLQDGVNNLDFAKATTSLDIMKKTVSGLSFKSLTEGVGDFSKSLLNLGKAILANPITLLATVVVGIVAAICQLKDAAGFAGKAFEVLGNAVKEVIKVFKELLDYIGLTDFAGQERSKKAIENAGKEKAAIEERYNAELALLKATGATSQEIFNTQKKQYDELISANQKIISSLNERKAAGVALNEEQKKQLLEAEKAHREYVNAVKVLEAERKKSIEDANKAIQNTIQDLRVKRTKSQVDDIKLAAARQKEALKDSAASEEEKAKLIQEIDRDAQIAISKYYAEQSKIRADKATADAEKSKTEKIAILNDELKQIQQLREIDSQQLDLTSQQNIDIVKDGIDLELAYYKNLSAEQLKLLDLTHNDIIQKELDLAAQKKAIQDDYNTEEAQKKADAAAKDKELKDLQRDNQIEANNSELDQLDWLFNNKKIKAGEYFDKTKDLLLKNLGLQKQAELDSADELGKSKEEIEKRYGEAAVRIEEDTQKKKTQARIKAAQEGIGIAQQFVGAISSINDLITNSENARLKKGEVASLATQRKQFNRKKSLEIVQANMSGAQAVLSAIASGPPPYNFILAGLSGAAAAIQIAAISRQQFNPESASSANTSTSTNIVSSAAGSALPSIPAIQSFNIGNSTPLPPNGGPDAQRVILVESDVTSIQRKVDVIESRASISIP